ncbi:MAG: MAPEG family protein [Alcanivoracaceae bacterium]|nr:MAPEG family protein [Alcanivoracaceae bacterium]
MQTASPILTPVIVLVAWSLVMWLWMYITRLPAMQKMQMKPDPQAPRGEQMNQLPASVRWKADNYNHLMEQPTIFYALALALAMLGQGEGLNLVLAWSYVGLRVVHSLWQALFNVIEVRFVLFVLSSLVLISLTLSALKQVL